MFIKSDFSVKMKGQTNRGTHTDKITGTGGIPSLTSLGGTTRPTNRGYRYK